MNTVRELNVEELNMVSGAGIGPATGALLNGIEGGLKPTESIPVVGTVTGIVDGILGAGSSIVTALP
ncbi:hypothetical protein [Kosakonia sp. MUSA4]|uniref:hypothetical protein n=1 Tax=Kosakonia sp. MUSA4 TaxID=2067958 RepID=UPI0015977721|nr:hypothetical protein [Kosakonia sp. MUSA4]QJT83183.1 hypothetical protein C0557_25375 [Kosakonia sp. MUSA4]